MKPDILNKKDIELLVDRFYTKALVDDVIGYIFTSVVQMDFEEHKPILYQFWDSVAFGTATYQGNPMIKHIELNQLEPLTNQHFDQWIFLWNQAVDELFEGQKADEVKQKAQSIRLLMQMKIKRNEKQL